MLLEALSLIAILRMSSRAMLQATLSHASRALGNRKIMYSESGLYSARELRTIHNR